MEIAKSIQDGTEERQVRLRLREGGIQEIIVGLGKSGFVSTGPGRISIVDGEIVIDFCLNTGTYESGVRALGLAVDVPLADFEKKLLPVIIEEEEYEEIIPATATPSELSPDEIGGSDTM